MRFAFAWSLAVVTILAQPSLAEGYTRASAIRSLRACNGERVKTECSEDAANYLMGKFYRGDQALLPLLIRTGLRADGALATDLADFYADLLSTRPELFLEQLRGFSPSDQGQLAWLAGTGDGGGLAPDELKTIVANLHRLAASGSPNHRRLARFVLREVLSGNRRANGEPPN